jgi:beta-ribofuranosylaminobenzene 5'-phosphate synthase
MRFSVKSPSRLHMSLIDLNGSLGRIDGGFGLTLASPNWLIEFSDECEAGFHFEGPEEVRVMVGDVIKRIGNQFAVDFPKLSIKIIEAIPAHVGLGSKSQLLLSIAAGLCHLINREIKVFDLAKIVQRGGTSGIGYLAFDLGGFIVDVGHSFGDQGEKHSFLPSSVSHAPPAMPVFRADLPNNWEILLVQLNVHQGANNSEEVNIFQSKCPIRLEEVEKISHRVLMQVIPAIKSNNLSNLADALHFIGHHGFKAIETRLQDPLVADLIEVIFNNFHIPVGMSSFGPIIYCIAYSSALISSIMAFIVKYMESSPNSPDVHFVRTKPSNCGYSIF